MGYGSQQTTGGVWTVVSSQLPLAESMAVCVMTNNLLWCVWGQN